MRLWMTKLSVVLITLVTLGMYIPPTYLDAKVNDQEQVTKGIENEHAQLLATDYDVQYLTEEQETLTVHEQFVYFATEQAKLQALQKFGPKITEAVGDEFLQIILPKMEEVISEIANEASVDQVSRFEISEKPAKGYGEKIVHIFDLQTGNDVARFHVRRVKHPRDGYFFNFHYHLNEDRFEHHYELGDIYWDKNTPPKWMS